MFAFTNFNTFVPVQPGVALGGFAEKPKQTFDFEGRDLPGRLDRPSAFVNALASVNEALDQLQKSEQALEQQLSDLRGYIGEAGARAVPMNAG